MKSLFFIILTVLAFSQCADAKIDGKNTNNLPFSEDGWKQVSFEKAGLTMNVPAEFINEEWRNEPDRKEGSVFSKTWKISYQQSVDVRVTVSKEFSLPNNLKTSSPEERLKSALQGYSKNTYLQEVKPLDLNGFKGIFTRSPNGSDKNDTTFRWVIYRFYQGQAQEFQINVSGNASEPEKLMKVFDSVRLTDKKIEIEQSEELAKSIENDWRTEKLESADLTINIPSEFKYRNFSGSLRHNENIVSRNYDKTWEFSNEISNDYEVSVRTVDWEKDFPPFRGKVETPEEAIETEYWIEQAAKLNPPVPSAERKVDEVKYLEIDGLKGIYVSIINSPKADKLEIIWNTFRHYNGNGQKITISIIGKQKEREKLENILKSVKFVKK